MMGKRLLLAIKELKIMLSHLCKHVSKCATRKDLLRTEMRLTNLILSGSSPSRVRFDWAIGPVQIKARSKDSMIIKITNEQQVVVTLNPKTDAGKRVEVDGVPAWEVVSGSSTVEPSEDGKSATLVSSDDPGDTQILVKADADLGEGVEEISEIIELQVAGATAKNLGLVVGTPTLKPVVE